MVIYNRDFYAGVSEGSASVLEDLVLEPLPQQRDAVLAPHGGGEAEQLMGQIVGGEVPPDLPRPGRPVLNRVIGQPGRLAAQIRELGQRRLDAGGGVHHGTAGDVLLQRELERLGDVGHVHVVTGGGAVAVDDQRHAVVQRLEVHVEHTALAVAPGSVHVAEADRDGR